MARCIAATRDKRLEIAIARLHLSVLEKTLAGSWEHNLSMREVVEALTFLKNRSAIRWPFDQFREALDNRVEAHRRQHLNVSLNAIRRVLGPDLSGHFPSRYGALHTDRSQQVLYRA
jgi:hypothetical protein